MKKTALIFLFAIFVPALLLGGLALRTASKQQLIIERQEAELRQKESDALAAQIRLVLATEHQLFVKRVSEMLGDESPEELAKRFSPGLSGFWSRRGVGFAVTTSGMILSPQRKEAAKGPIQEFLFENRGFLGNELAAEVYNYSIPQQQQIAQSESIATRWRSSALGGAIEEEREEEPARSGRLAKEAVPATAAPAPQDMADRGAKMEPLMERADSADLLKAEGDQLQRAGEAKMTTEMAEAKALEPEPKSRVTAVTQAAPAAPAKDSARQAVRKVAPQNPQQEDLPAAQLSKLKLETTSFGQIVSEQTEGIISRFVQDQLEIIFWVRFPADPRIVFGVQIQPSDLRDVLAPVLRVRNSGSSRSSVPEVCVALLDDRARPFEKSIPDFSTDWKRPFVASEVGEVLPHWEVALYLTDPARLARSARLVQLTLVALIALALAAIAFGSYLVVTDTRRQLLLVQKKTDFVSNVSHELKTPLTSIRMFAELLYDNRVSEEKKKQKYLRIITLEADRLTRLINNVLDFAKMERNERRYQKRVLDLHGVIQKVWDSVEMHLEEEGFDTRWDAADPPYRVNGDEDALAQVIMNLLSNAEKYSGDHRSVELHSYILDGWVCVSVLDRGTGVPAGEEHKIFEHFYRAHDSLSSGIQGTGLGLTLAINIAQDHGGTIKFDRRKGGGSSFTLRLPEITKS